jgi:zinc protease
LLRGGGGYSAKSVSDEVERLGLTVRIAAGWDSTDLVISGPSDALDSIFDLINHLVITPAFDQKELDALKTQRIAEIKGAADDNERLQDLAVAELYGTYPYGKSLTGTPESLQQIARTDLQDYYARLYLANNAQLLVQGDVSAEQVTRFARARLGTWKKGELVPPNFRQPEKLIGNHFVLLDRPNATGTHAVVVMPGFSRRAPDYFAAAMAVDIFNQMLAQTGLGLTVKTNARVLAGPLMIELNAPSGKVLETIKNINDLMSRMQAQPPTLEQVEAAKGRLISNMAERLRSDAAIADIILDVETYGLGRDYLLRHAERVNAVTPAEIQAAARAYLVPQSMVVAVSGPAGQLEADAKKAGVVTVVH